jgi:hypothetical protein
MAFSKCIKHQAENPSVFAHELKSFIAGQSAGVTNFTKPLLTGVEVKWLSPNA